jgi:NAD(P)H-quinone oxidoreductase subunit 5
MMETAFLFVVAAPGVTFLLFSLAWLLGVELRERTLTSVTNAVFTAMALVSAWLGLSMYAQSLAEIHWDGGIWFRAGEYAFQLDLIGDWLAMPLIALTAVLVGLVGLFSARYMHRESGFVRFFLLLHLFAFGSMLVFAAGSFDLFIGGWELVGISSALLVAFFQQRREPVRSSVHVFSIYRIGDLGLLVGVFVLHYLGGTAEIGRIFSGAWPQQSSALSPTAATLTGLLFLFAAAAKSAQVPFFGWLPRAMEGPTPSSAIFYGAISVHAGAYLLLRIYPALDASPLAASAVVAVGVVSAIVGTALHRVVADAKSGIAYAVMTQLGIIFIEIGLGFPKLA